MAGLHEQGLGVRLLSGSSSSLAREYLSWDQKSYQEPEMVVDARVLESDRNATATRVIVATGGDAVSRNVVWIAFRGTSTPEHLLVDMDVTLAELDTEIHQDGAGARVHGGFQRAYLSIRRALRTWLDVQGVRPESETLLRLTGHSLGGAIAHLCNVDLATDGFRTQLVTFGCPQVGDNQFKEIYRSLDLVGETALFVNKFDVVPYLLRMKGTSFVDVCEPTVLDSFCTLASESLEAALQTYYASGIIPTATTMSDQMVQQHRLHTYSQHLDACFTDLQVVLLEKGMRATQDVGPLILNALTASSPGIGGPIGAAIAMTWGILWDLQQKQQEGFRRVDTQIKETHASILRKVEQSAEQLRSHLDCAEIRKLQAHLTTLVDNETVCGPEWVFNASVHTLKLAESLRLLAVERIVNSSVDVLIRLLEILCNAHRISLRIFLALTRAGCDSTAKKARTKLQGWPVTLMDRLAPLIGEFVRKFCSSIGQADRELPALIPLKEELGPLLPSPFRFKPVELLMLRPDDARVRCELALSRRPLGHEGPEMDWFRDASHDQNRASWAAFVFGAVCIELRDEKSARNSWKKMDVNDFHSKATQMRHVFPEALRKYDEGFLNAPDPEPASLRRMDDGPCRCSMPNYCAIL